MKLTHHPLVLILAASLVLNAAAKNPVLSTVELTTQIAYTEPFGQITFGAKFSKDLQSGYVDVLRWLFVNLRGTADDNNQQLASVGMGFRYLLQYLGVIFVENAFYDFIDSA